MTEKKILIHLSIESYEKIIHAHELIGLLFYLLSYLATVEVKLPRTGGTLKSRL